VEQTTMKKIPAWMALGEILATALVALSIVSIVVYAPFWILAGISKRRRRPAERALRLWPLLAVLSVLAIVGLFILCGDDVIGRLGNLTVWSASLWALTLLFAVTSIASAFYSWQSPAPAVRRGVRRFSIIVSAALLIATAYLVYWGFIGVRTWA
jgi:NADH:ubiquinone oxidoreductase subunit 2 (subunit N)